MGLAGRIRKIYHHSYPDTEQLIKNIGMFGDHWAIDNIYLAAMESLKIVIAKKNRVLQKMID